MKRVCSRRVSVLRESRTFKFKVGMHLSRKYVATKVLGKGTFASVLECWDTVNRKYVAVKVVEKSTPYFKAAEVEAKILKRVSRHAEDEPNAGVVEYIESFVHKGHFCIVMERLGTSLLDLFKDVVSSTFLIKQVAIAALKSVEFLHSLALVHCDLKPENILLSDNYKQDLKRDGLLRPKVIDFGNATLCSMHHDTIICTRYYRAPEVLLDLKWSYPSDIWALGCILAELCIGYPIFRCSYDAMHLALIEKRMGELPKEMKLNISSHRHRSYSFDDYEPRSSNYLACEKGNLKWPALARNNADVIFVNNAQSVRTLLSRHLHAWKKDDLEQFTDIIICMLCKDPCERATATELLGKEFFK